MCVCIRHANVSLMAEAAKVLPRSTSEIAEPKEHYRESA